MSELKRTSLYPAHLAAGASLVDFGGWEMPVQYPTGIVAEHLYDRRHCGIFDVSHMGRLLVEGPDRLAFLQKVLSGNAAALTPGRAQYCMIPTETGGAVDDAYLYMYEPENYMLIVNAANTEKDLAHFARYLPDYDCRITNITDSYSSIAVQGPEAEAILKELSGAERLTGPKKNDLGQITIQGKPVRVSKTGYTGDPIGYEVFIDAKDAVWLWNLLIDRGAQPTGLGARDTLRLEAGLPLYGHELGTAPDGKEIPIFAVSLARFAVSFAPEKGDFVGRAALEAQRAGTEKKIVPITLTDRGVLRGGMEVLRDGQAVGWVTSGTMVPYWVLDEQGRPTEATGRRSIGFAYVDSRLGPGDTVQVNVRGKLLRGELVKRHMRQDLPPYGRAELLK